MYGYTVGRSDAADFAVPESVYSALIVPPLAMKAPSLSDVLEVDCYISHFGTRVPEKRQVVRCDMGPVGDRNIT